MISIQDNNLRETLSHYNEIHFFITALKDDIENNLPIEDIAFTTQLLYEQIEQDLEYNPVLPAVIDEIRRNHLNLNTDESNRYKSYVKKYVADHDNRFVATITLLKKSITGNIEKYKEDALKRKMYDQTYQSKHVKTLEDAKECYKNALYYFILSWEHLKQTIDNEFNSTVLASELPSAEEETPERVTTKQGILLLEKTGWFELQNTEEKDKTKIAKVVAALMGRSYKNVYDAIRERRYLEKNQNDVKRVKELLGLLDSAK